MTPGDPWSFQRWAYQTKVGSPARKAVLMVLATMADSNTGRCEPLQETLAEACETSDRTVREHLKAMQAANIIARRRQHRFDGSRRGDEFLLLAPWVTEWPDGVKVLTEDSSARPTGSSEQGLPEDSRRSNRKTPSAQERPGRTTKEQSTKENARAKSQQLPDDFPEALKPHARRVFAILRDVAEQHNAKAVTPRAVGLAIQSHPGRRFVGVAYDLAGWAQTSRKVKDAVSTYRTFLNGAEAFEGIEVFDAAPIAAKAGPGGHLRVVNGRERVDWGAVAADLEARGM